MTCRCSRWHPAPRPSSPWRSASRSGPRELLGASTAVRGTDDPTDPTTAKLAPLLRAAIGDERYASAYDAGRALGRAGAIERLDPAGL